MEKQTLTVKIIAGIVVLICLWGAILALKAMCSTESAIAAASLFVVFVICILPIALICGPMFAHWFAGQSMRKIYLPGDKDVREAPPEFAELRAKIARGDIHEAMKELESRREEDPQNYFVVSLMSDVYIDITNDYQSAAILLIDYLKKPLRNDNDVGFVMKLADVYLEHDGVNSAVELLKSEIEKKYSSKVIETLRKRLDGITS